MKQEVEGPDNASHDTVGSCRTRTLGEKSQCRRDGPRSGDVRRQTEAVEGGHGKLHPATAIRGSDPALRQARHKTAAVAARHPANVPSPFRGYEQATQRPKIPGQASDLEEPVRPQRESVQLLVFVFASPTLSAAVASIPRRVGGCASKTLIAFKFGSVWWCRMQPMRHGMGGACNSSFVKTWGQI